MQIWLTSDTHLAHPNIIWFVDDEGYRIRPFDTWEQHDDYLVEMWNSVVKPEDHVYHLGDVAMNRKGLARCDELHGHKRLVRGNHDIYRTRFYLPYFKEIYGVRVLDGVMMTHIPVHPDSIIRGYVNAHGHLHQNHLSDPRYVNVCVENHNYMPIPIEEVKERGNG